MSNVSILVHNRLDFLIPFAMVAVLITPSFASAETFMSSHTFNSSATVNAAAVSLCRETGNCSSTAAGELHPYPQITGQVLRTGCFTFRNKSFNYVGPLGSPNAAGYRCQPGQVEAKVGFRADCPPTPTNPTPATCTKGGYLSLGCTVRKVPGNSIGDRILVNYECFGGNRILVDSTSPGGTAQCSAGNEFNSVSGTCTPCSAPVAGEGGSYKTSSGQGACIPCTNSTTVDGHGTIVRVVDASNIACNVKQVNCAAGYEPDATGVACRLMQCQAGFYRTSPTSTSCDPCPAGTYKSGTGDGPCTLCPGPPTTPLPPNTTAAGVTLGTWDIPRANQLTGSTSEMNCNYKVNSCESPYTVASPPANCANCVPSVDPIDVNSCAYKQAQTCQGVAVTGTGTCAESCGFGSKVGGTCTGSCPATNPTVPYPAGVSSYTLVPGSVPPTCAYQITSCSTGYGLVGSGTSANCVATPPGCALSATTSGSNPTVFGASNGNVGVTVSGYQLPVTVTLQTPPAGYIYATTVTVPLGASAISGPIVFDYLPASPDALSYSFLITDNTGFACELRRTQVLGSPAPKCNAVVCPSGWTPTIHRYSQETSAYSQYCAMNPANCTLTAATSGPNCESPGKPTGYYVQCRQGDPPSSVLYNGMYLKACTDSTLSPSFTYWNDGNKVCGY